MDHRSMLAWADGHLERTDAEIKKYTGKYPYRGRHIDDPKKPNEVSVVLREWRETPRLRLSPDAMPMAGDTIHALRMALDYLAFRLVPEPVRSANVSQILFPVCTESGQYPDIELRRLPGVDGRALAIIKRLQPCYSRKRKSLHPLALLNALENVYKHRRLLAGDVGMTSLKIWTTGPRRGMRVLWEDAYLFPVNDEAEVARYRLLQPLEGEEKVYSRAEFYVSFKEYGIAARLPIITTLKAIRDHLRDTVFPKLERYTT